MTGAAGPAGADGSDGSEGDSFDDRPQRIDELASLGERAVGFDDIEAGNDDTFETDEFQTDDDQDGAVSHRGAFGEFGGESDAFIERTFRERIVLVGVALQPGEEHIDTQDGDAHWRFTVPRVALNSAQLAHREWEL